MQGIALEGHYGRSVEIDRCARCHLVWFDSVESVRLAGTGLLALLSNLAEAQSEPHVTLRPDARCPRCSGALKTVHNRSRWGPTLQFECRRGHGAFQTFAQFLSEKGLVRALSAADRAALGARDETLACLNCGAPIGMQDARCRYCDSLPGLVDVARLARALDPEGATEAQAVHGVPAERASLHCLACGGPLPTGLAAVCVNCGATLAVTQMRRAVSAVRVLEDGLRAHARQPAPHVKARRLAALETDLPRRREWVRLMEAETEAAHGHMAPRSFFDDARERPWATAIVAVVLVALWLLWG